MKIPIEKSIYRRVYLQLRTGFLKERPLFYDAIRLNPPPVFRRSNEKLPNLVGLEDRLIQRFKNKYVYHYEDFASDHHESSRYVAYNFVKKQTVLIHQGMSEKKAFKQVEREFLAEMDALNSRIFPETSMTRVEELKRRGNIGEKFKPKYFGSFTFESEMNGFLRKELSVKQRSTIFSVIDKTIESYKTLHGDHVISDKLKELEDFRKDKVSISKSIKPVLSMKPYQMKSPVDVDFVDKDTEVEEKK